MKKTLPIVLTLVCLCFCMSGCGKAKEVPDTMVDWAVQDYLEQNKNLGGDYSGYEATITHAPDKETNTDFVTVNLIINYPHLVASSRYEATYRYDKASDWWDVIRGGEWSQIQFDKIDMPTSMELWEKAFLEYSGLELSNIKEYTYEKEEDWKGIIELSGLSSEALKEGWLFLADADSAGDGSFSWYSTDNIDNAEQLFDSMIAFYRDSYEKNGANSPQKTGKGINYQYSTFTTEFNMRVLTIRQDTSVFILQYYMYNDNINTFLVEMGFIPFVS